MSEELQTLIDENLDELFANHDFNFIRSASISNGSLSEYHHQHLILKVLLEGGQFQILVGSTSSPRDLWPIPLLLDTLQPLDKSRTLSPPKEQAQDLLSIWDQLLPLLSPEQFPGTRQKVLHQIRTKSEKLFNFSDLHAF